MFGHHLFRNKIEITFGFLLFFGMSTALKKKITTRSQVAVLPTKNSTCVKSGVLHFKFRFFSYYFLFTFCLYWYKLNSINRRFIPAVPTLRWQAVASLLWPNKIVFPIYYHLVLIHTSSFYPNNQIIINILYLVEELKCNDGKLQLAFGY